MTDDLIRMAREEVEAFNEGDWDRLKASLASDSVYDEAATGRRMEGPDAIVEANQGWKSAFPDASGTITGSFACGDRVVLEITWRGTQSGALPLPDGGEIPATGRSVEIQACQVMRIADGKVAENRHFFDMLGMMEQLGALSGDALAQAG